MANCSDKKCPVHGHVKVRGNVFKVKVISARAKNTITGERKILQYIPKYERYKKITSTIHAHNPECIKAKEGDIVTVGETRKLSKTKNFTVLEIEEGENK